MRLTTFAIALGSLLLLNLSASADTFTLNVTGGGADADDYDGFDITGTGLSIVASNDFGPANTGGLVPGQSYSVSYDFYGFESFEGFYGGVPIVGNGVIDWQFTLVVPNSPDTSLGSSISLPAAPGTLTGYFSFCSPAVYEQVSSCGPDDNPLGSATITGTGTNIADLGCSESGTCVLYDDTFQFTATADMDVVPEPPTLALVGSSLLAYPMFLIWRPSSRHLPRVRSS